MALMMLTLAGLTVAAQVAVPSCTSANQQAGARDTPRVGSQKLGDLPPAQEIKAVYRIIDGCSRPILVRSQGGEKRPR